MSNFIALKSNQSQRLDHYAARLYRIEVHLRRAERRAARAQLNGLLEELEYYRQELELPMEFIIAGINVGFLSGKGALWRGRLPGAVLGALGGWMYGQSVLVRQRDAVVTLMEQTVILEHALAALDADAAGATRPPTVL